jgi:hypothetical protein
MNKKFVTKMMQAKQLQYEALKEIMPEKVAVKVERLENELLDIGKEYIMAVINTKNDKPDNQDKGSKTRKVTIE